MALLAAIDSAPPPAGPAELAPGIPYDPIMESAWLRALAAGEDAPAPATGRAAAELAAWLGGAGGPGVTRYLHEAWRWRDDLQRAWPDPLGADAPALAEWGWDHGARELDLVRALLKAKPLRERRRGSVGGRGRGGEADDARTRDGGARAAMDLLERRLDRPLPQARERLDRRVLAAARRARRDYRAKPWPGTVLLVTSTEFATRPSHAAWQLRALGGVERRPLPVGHVEMLREPGAELLARSLEDRIAEVLGP